VSGPIYHLFARAYECRAVVSLNGFPAVEIEPSGIVRSAAPMVNQLLVGPGNRLEVTLSALGGDGRGPLGVATFEGSVRSFQRSEPWAQARGGVEVASFEFRAPLGDEMAPHTVELPLSMTTVRFDSEGPSFRERLLDGPRIAADEVVAYAMKLRGVFAAQDRAAIARELTPKFADFARGYHATVDQILADLDAHLTNKLFRRGLLLDFTADDVVATPWCDARVWRIQRGPGEPFVRTRRDEQGLDSFMEIFVGRVDGELRVVR
jgi:hypothetical protein